MAQESPLPPPIEAAATTDRTTGTDPVLLRLHAALKGLDAAICETRRALDVALGRSPSSAPPEGLRYRELGRLEDHLQVVTEAPAQATPRSLANMALDRDPADGESEDSEPASDSDVS
jgi:hypothetical protein